MLFRVDEQLLLYRADTSKLDELLQAVTVMAKRIATRIDKRVDADEIAQQVTIEVWQQIDRVGDHIAGLVVAKTRSRVIDAQRSLLVHARNVPLTTDFTRAEKRHSDPRINQARRIAADILGEQAFDLLQRGYTFDEIAELTNTPPSTVRSRMQKVKKLAAASSKQAA